MDRIKFGLILLALVQPLMILYHMGFDCKSFSKCWGTDLEPMFIIVNFTTSYFFFGLNRWKIPAVFLLLTTAFSTDLYSSTHNIFAVCFFVSCIYSLSEYKRMRNYLYFYCFSVFMAIFGLFWFELFATWVLCFYHLHLFLIKISFENRNIEN